MNLSSNCWQDEELDFDVCRRAPTHIQLTFDRPSLERYRAKRRHLRRPTKNTPLRHGIPRRRLKHVVA